MRKLLHRLRKKASCGERAGRDFVDFLALEVKMIVPMVLGGNFNLFEDHRDKLNKYLYNHVNFEFDNYSG